MKDSRKIQKLMYKDPELNIGNLNYFIYQGEQLLTDRPKQQYSVACLNITQFQNYVAIYGWNNGQRLLKTVADALSHTIKDKNEICARADGDHFVLLLSAENGSILYKRASFL